jgi:hypothetical protein
LAGLTSGLCSATAVVSRDLYRAAVFWWRIRLVTHWSIWRSCLSERFRPFGEDGQVGVVGEDALDQGIGDA